MHRKLKPVYWSPSSRTALAEAELEYNEEHVSIAAWVGMRITEPAGLPTIAHDAKATIWTTTPWTLPANSAVAFAPDTEYCVVRDRGEKYVVSVGSLERLCEALGVDNMEELGRFPGSAFQGAICEHPVLDDQISPMIPGEHVTDDMGSGLVHTAPAHGAEDFDACIDHPDLPLRCPVDNAGRFNSTVGIESLVGLPVRSPHLCYTASHMCVAGARSGQRSGAGAIVGVRRASPQS